MADETCRQRRTNLRDVRHLGGRYRLPECASHLGTESASGSVRPLRNSGGSSGARPLALDSPQVPLLSTGEGSQPRLSRQVRRRLEAPLPPTQARLPWEARASARAQTIPRFFFEVVLSDTCAYAEPAIRGTHPVEVPAARRQRLPPEWFRPRPASRRAAPYCVLHLLRRHRIQTHLRTPFHGRSLAVGAQPGTRLGSSLTRRWICWRCGNAWGIPSVLPKISTSEHRGRHSLQSGHGNGCPNAPL